MEKEEKLIVNIFIEFVKLGGHVDSKVFPNTNYDFWF
jgi:hypothetical protein